MNIDSLLNSFQHFGIRLGLERIQELLADLGNPHHSVPIIHVAGTNGKGSVCAYLSAVLTEAGYKVGRYTSPHLVDWTENIYLNEQPIATQELAKILLQIQEVIPDDCEDCPTQFEVITAAAWLYFAQQQVDIAVIEVGLGGRLDATNVSDCPLVSIITSLSREHWQQLGSTLADIAGEKAGILKPNCPAVIGLLPSEAKQVVATRVKQLNCPTVWVEPATEGKISKEKFNLNQELIPRWACYQGIEYPLPLLGDVQLINSAIAIAALQSLQQQGWEITQEAIQIGMAKTNWQGRLQWTSWHNHRILVDGAHNSASAQALRHYVDTLKKQGRRQRAGGRREDDLACLFPSSEGMHRPSGAFNFPITWVMGMLSTKDHAEIFKALLRPGDRLYLLPVPDYRSAEPEELQAIAKNICPKLTDCSTYLSIRFRVTSSYLKLL